MDMYIYIYIYTYNQKRDLYLLVAEQKWLSTEALLTHICSRQMAILLSTLVPCDNCTTTLFQIIVPHWRGPKGELTHANN